MYSNQELAEIHFMHGKADGNAALARRLYQERYPQRQRPDRNTFVQVQEEILEAVNMTPSIRTRRVALQVNVPHTTVWRLLKEYQLYPYHLQRVQALSPADYPAQVRRSMRHRCENEASKAIGLEVNPENTKYMIMSRDGNIARNGNINIGDLSFEEVEKFKYLGATVTNINDTREEIKRRINMGNACYYSVEKLLSSSLQSKNLKVRIYKTVILPVLLYGCETWTLTLREEHRLRVFENKVLRKIFGAKRDEVTGEWRKLHNTELHALYSSPDIIRNLKSRRLRWAGHVARMGESRNAYRVLVGRPEGKRPLGRPRRRWEDNIKMDLREVGYDDRDWLNLAQDRDRWRAYVRAAMNLRGNICTEHHVARVVRPAQLNDDDDVDGSSDFISKHFLCDVLVQLLTDVPETDIGASVIESFDISARVGEVRGLHIACGCLEKTAPTLG
ncbi:hypothetical protein ANN_22065 [Periplaneta americana]|uniref:DUF4817 domain-containing protein n=1 Tax=Periplaneta americana TaxID=6978 RepID=A0ABQ8S7V8_PERAM|nr:hypothetical protein ANN_22065 [Periplaneta americana]